MRWEWIAVVLVVVLIIRAVLFSIGNARARRSSRYLQAATAVMKELAHFDEQFSRLPELDHAQIAVASLQLQELCHQVRSWDAPAMDRERHRHLIDIVTSSAEQWEGASNLTMEEMNDRIDRTNAIRWAYLKTRGWKDPYTPPPRNVCNQSRISAFFFGNRC